jgi:hypothetical protein
MMAKQKRPTEASPLDFVFMGHHPSIQPQRWLQASSTFPAYGCIERKCSADVLKEISAEHRFVHGGLSVFASSKRAGLGVKRQENPANRGADETSRSR